MRLGAAFAEEAVATYPDVVLQWGSYRECSTVKDGCLRTFFLTHLTPQTSKAGFFPHKVRCSSALRVFGRFV